MAEYTKKEIEAFRRKDCLYARQTAANCTAMVFEGKEPDEETFIKYAEKLFSWLFQEQENVKTNDTAAIPDSENKSEPPVPQLKEKNILDLIAAKLDMAEKDIRPLVHKWAKENYDVNYPSKPAAVNMFIKWYNENQ